MCFLILARFTLVLPVAPQDIALDELRRSFPRDPWSTTAELVD